MSELSPSAQPEERLRADLLLLLTAVIWGTAFVAQRTAAQSTSVFLFNGMRFLLGALVLLPLAWRNGDITNPAILQRRSLLGILVAGLLIFTAGTFQQMGLRYTTAGNAGFISGLYVVLIPVILAISGKQRQRPAIWIAVLLATVGLFLLSTGGQLRLKLGDSLELAGALRRAGGAPVGAGLARCGRAGGVWVVGRDVTHLSSRCVPACDRVCRGGGDA